MQITTTKSEIRLKNAVQFLGRKEERYFASGYKKVICELSDCQITDNKLTACLKLAWGKNWSIKKGKETDQHMGSIDSSLVAIRSLELFLAVKYNMTEEEISASFIKRIEFKTSPSCRLNQPSDVEVTVIHSYFNDKDSFIGKFGVQVKNFHFLIELDLSFGFSLSKTCKERFALPINDPIHYYTCGYKLTSVDIENIFLNLKTRSVTAESKIVRSKGVFESGLGVRNLPRLTFIEYLGIIGQLTQILLYKLENTTREESNNMWVRSLCADFYPAENNQLCEVFSTAYFTEFNQVKIKNDTWRTVTSKFEIGNIRGSAKVCHII
ncbi:MAG: hypothetical protein K0M40_12130 [Prolixibacteraceae bacterium]|nr:hypothetical protein [Prolixibacteraceae bacterium]